MQAEVMGRGSEMMTMDAEATKTASLAKAGTQNDQAEARIEQHRCAVENVQKGKVCINVGGRLFTTSMASLTRVPTSLLASLPYVTPCPDDGAVFLDRDPDMFALVLQYLRTGVAPELDSRAARRQLATEARYYGLCDLAVAVQHGIPLQDDEAPGVRMISHFTELSQPFTTALWQHLESNDAALQNHLVSLWRQGLTFCYLKLVQSDTELGEQPTIDGFEIVVRAPGWPGRARIVLLDWLTWHGFTAELASGDRVKAFFPHDPVLHETTRVLRPTPTPHSTLAASMAKLLEHAEMAVDETAADATVAGKQAPSVAKRRKWSLFRRKTQNRL